MEAIASVGEDTFHLYQRVEDFSYPAAFSGKISDQSVVHNGHKYRVIDEAIAVRERMISCRAQLVLGIAEIIVLPTATILGALIVTIGAIGVPAVALVGFFGVVTAGALEMKRCIEFLNNYDGYDAYGISSFRQLKDFNKRDKPFSEVLKYFNFKLESARKCFTDVELQYAFDKELSRENYIALLSRVPLAIIQAFSSEDSFKEGLKKGLKQGYENVHQFFKTYETAHFSLEEMYKLGIFSLEQWEQILELQTDYSKIMQPFDLEQIDILNNKKREINLAKGAFQTIAFSASMNIDGKRMPSPAFTADAVKRYQNSLDQIEKRSSEELKKLEERRSIASETLSQKFNGFLETLR